LENALYGTITIQRRAHAGDVALNNLCFCRILEKKLFWFWFYSQA
jgi:hypothetical protein